MYNRSIDIVNEAQNIYSKSNKYILIYDTFVEIVRGTAATN